MSFIEQKFSEPAHPIVKQYFTSSRDIESWSKEHMRRYHEEAIRRVLEHAYKDNNFYREKFAAKGVRPDEFRSVEDIRKFPFITKDEMRGKPYVLLSVPRERISQVHLSTGTTGGEHIYTYYTWEDYFINFVAPDMPQLMSLTVDDVMINALPHEMSLAGLGAHNLFQKGVGVLMVPAGKGGLYSTPESLLTIARDLKAVLLMTTALCEAYLSEIADKKKKNDEKNINVGF